MEPGPNRTRRPCLKSLPVPYRSGRPFPNLLPILSILWPCLCWLPSVVRLLHWLLSAALICLGLPVCLLHPGMSTPWLHIEPPSPSLHLSPSTSHLRLGPSSFQLHWASSSLQLRLSQLLLCLRRGIPGLCLRLIPPKKGGHQAGYSQKRTILRIRR